MTKKPRTKEKTPPMTESELRQQRLRAELERKISAYRYLFEHGIESPTDEQAQRWATYEDRRDRGGPPCTIDYARERVRIKAFLLTELGLRNRGRTLHNYLDKSTPNSPENRITKLTRTLATTLPNLHQGSPYRWALAQLIQSHLTRPTDTYRKHYETILSDFKVLEKALTNWATPASLIAKSIGELHHFHNNLDTICTTIHQAEHLGIDTGYRIHKRLTRQGYYQANHDLRKADYDLKNKK